MSGIMFCPELRFVRNYDVSGITFCPELRFVQNYDVSGIMSCPEIRHVRNYVHTYAADRCTDQGHHSVRGECEAEMMFGWTQQ